ncbi:MAG: sigma-70 family RNA polymerase sigma factor [Cyanobacteriota bacterium]|nr:sigma-70 family RNA polymerase sigma factor [Cyanobacteriota bacterium]
MTTNKLTAPNSILPCNKVYRSRPSHRDTIESFSTFMRLEDNTYQGWTADRQLRRSMENCLARVDNMPASDSFWAMYWHRRWLSASDRLAEAHLSAYLQEPCYWAAKRILSSCINPSYQLADYFQIAIAAVPKVLKGFDRERSSSLKNYASIVFRSILRDALRSSQEADICTDWGLLRKLSKKRLEEALLRAGFAPETIARYHLAWMCFKRLYVPTPVTGIRCLPPPSSQLWEAIARAYNRDRFFYLNSPGSPGSPRSLKRWLLECAKLVRSYLYPLKTPLNENLSGLDKLESIDAFRAEVNWALLEQLIEQEHDEERQWQRQQLNTFLETALSTLKPQSQELVKLYYRSKLTQQQIANQLDMKQYQVSRQLARARESLLKALAQWSQKTWNVALTSERLKQMSVLLGEWLWEYYPTYVTLERAGQRVRSRFWGDVRI